MGFRTPQQLQRTQQDRPTPRGRFTGSASSQIGTEFLGTISRNISAQAKAEEAKRRTQEDFVDAVTRNKLKTAQVEAKEKMADLKGISALQETPEIRKEYSERVKEIMQESPESYRNSLRAQKAVLNTTGDFTRFAIGYTHNEGRKIQDDAFNTKMANDMDDIVERSSDVEYIAGEGIDNLTESIIQKSQRTYGTDRNVKLQSGLTAGNMIDVEVETGVSEAIRKSIQMQVSSNRFDLAEDTVKRLADKLTPADRVKVAKIIDSGKKDSEDNQSLALADQAYQTAGGDLVGAEEFIRAASGTNAGLYKKSLSMVQTRAQIDKRAKDKREDDAYDGLYDQMIREGRMDQRTLMALPPEKRNKLIQNLNDNRGRAAIVTDYKVFDKMKRDMGRMTDKDIVNLNLNTMLQHSVNIDDIKTLEKWQQTAKARIDSGFASGSRFKTSVPDRMTAMFAKQFGIHSRSKKYGKLNSLISDAYSDILISNPKITDGEVDKLLKRNVSDNIRTEITENTFSPDEEIQVLPTDIDSLRNSNKSGLSPEDERVIQSARLRRGLPKYTESELIRFAQGRQAQ